jgi:hypothetical protein
MPIGDLYRDFAAANFGEAPAAAIAGVFGRIDGTRLPVPCHWVDGPGDIRRNPEPWSAVSAQYDFVGELEALRGRVRGAANQERYDYWLSQFRAMRLIAELGCTAGALDREVAALGATPDPAARREQARRMALPLRLRLAELWTQLLHTEIAGAGNSSELGAIANLEQRSRVHQHLLDKHDAFLIQALGCDLPAGARPSVAYAGPARIIVPVVRTAAAAGEGLRLRALLVAAQSSADAVLYWRPVGSRDYRKLPLRPVARWVWEVTLPAVDAQTPLIEYHLEAVLDGQGHRWPASDSGIDQTLVLFE